MTFLYVVTITLGFIGSILHLIFVVRGSLHGGTGKHEWDISVAQVLSPASLQVSVLLDHQIELSY